MTALGRTVEARSFKQVARDLVRLYVPEAAGEEQELRARICAARDRARSKSGWANSAEGSRLYELAADIAEQWWRRRDVSTESLFEVIKVFSWLALAAEKVEMLEAVTHE